MYFFIYLLLILFLYAFFILLFCMHFCFIIHILLIDPFTYFFIYIWFRQFQSPQSPAPLLSFLEIRDVQSGFFSADRITNNHLTLVADTDKKTDNRNNFMLSLCTPECKKGWDIVSKDGLFDNALLW